MFQVVFRFWIKSYSLQFFLQIFSEAKFPKRWAFSCLSARDAFLAIPVIYRAKRRTQEVEVEGLSKVLKVHLVTFF